MSETGSNESLTGKASTGFVWMVSQTVGSKIFGFAGQMVLARLLVPSDFGIMAMAYAAAAIPSMIRQTGITQILVQKQSSFDRWVSAGFWLELTLALITGLATAALAPAACSFFHTPRLFGPLILIAILAVTGAFNTPPYARLLLDLRFRVIAIAGILYNLAVVILSIILAWRGFGVYSFILPLPFVNAARAAFYWRLAPVRIRMQLQLHRWRPILLDSIFLMGSGLFATILGQADNVALGRFVTATEVGFYSVASNLSSQFLQMLSVNLSGVLFPTLSLLKSDPPRQTAAFFRAARLLALVGIPLCVLEAAMARPIITVIYGQKYLAAVPLLRLLALAAGVNLLFGPTQNYLQSQGRFGFLFKWMAFLATVFVLVVCVAAWRNGALSVAGGVLAVAGLLQPAGIYLASRGRGGNWRQVAGIYCPPLLISAAAILPVEALRQLVPLMSRSWWALALAGTATFPPLCVLFAWKFRGSDFAAATAQFRRMLNPRT
jgi:PST family polysaccharide transporter